MAYEILYGNSIDTDFILCEHLTAVNGSAIGSGASFINQFMLNHISKTPTNNTVIGIFDYDTTGFNEIAALRKQFNQKDKEIDKFLLYQHNTKKNIFVMTLVTPFHRDKFTNKTKADYCFLSTELLLEDKVIPVANKKFPTPFDETVFSFTGDKTSFANEIESKKNDVNFDGFRPTLELIKEIVGKASDGSGKTNEPREAYIILPENGRPERSISNNPISFMLAP
ncbi:MAG: hypothetical protein DU489_03945 [Nitrosomonas sp.]|uniref:hypothetical protein n=1 Tax=Nitrosomonas sp. TaxID=42353 RepID=UPI0032EC90D1